MDLFWSNPHSSAECQNSVQFMFQFTKCSLNSFYQGYLISPYSYNLYHNL